MKANRKIVLKSPGLRHLRSFLRQVLKLAVSDRYKALHEIFMDTDDKNYQNKIIQEEKLLTRASYRYPVACRLCGKVNLDLTYNDHLKAWYCDNCLPWIKI